MKGRAGGIEVSITARPAPPDATKVSVLWIERLDE